MKDLFRKAVIGWFDLLGRGRRVALDRRGGALVEFAFVAPLMMALMLGMFSIAMVMSNYMILTNGIGAGARAFALARGQTTPALAGSDPCQFAVNMAETAAPELNANSLTFSITYTNNTTSTPVSTTYSHTCAGLTLNSNDTVQISATYPSVLFSYGWSGPSFNLVARTAEQVQ